MRWVSAVQAMKTCRGYDLMGQFYDFFMEGQMGVLGAMETFDLDRGTRFSSYAYPSAGYAQKNYLRGQAQSVVPEPEREITADGRRVRTKIKRRSDLSLDEPISDGTGDDRYALYPDMSLNPERQAEMKEIQGKLAIAFTRLSDRERRAIYSCVLGDKILSDMREELGGVSTERVRQISVEGMKKLGQALADPKLMAAAANPVKRTKKAQDAFALPAAPVSVFTALVAQAASGPQADVAGELLYRVIASCGTPSASPMLRPAAQRVPTAAHN